MNLVNPYQEKITNLDHAKDMSLWGANAIDILRNHMQYDPVHDEAHLVRVLRNALWFGQGSDLNILIPAAILHDLINLPKDSPLRNQASRLSAQKAIVELEKLTPFKDTKQSIGIFHAIEAHSWSAGIKPLTLEAKALQDADRVDALGLIGIARMFASGGAMGRALFHPTDPLGEHRKLDESAYTLDHYFVKLQKIPASMQTERGKKYAISLARQMESFVWNLKNEL